MFAVRVRLHNVVALVVHAGALLVVALAVGVYHGGPLSFGEVGGLGRRNREGGLDWFGARDLKGHFATALATATFIFEAEVDTLREAIDLPFTNDKANFHASDVVHPESSRRLFVVELTLKGKDHGVLSLLESV